jgi:hypothetical protein
MPTRVSIRIANYFHEPVDVPDSQPLQEKREVCIVADVPLGFPHRGQLGLGELVGRLNLLPGKIIASTAQGFHHASHPVNAQPVIVVLVDDQGVPDVEGDSVDHAMHYS